MRILGIGATLAALAVGPVQAQDQVESLFYRALNFAGYSLAQSAVLAIRSRGEITYDAIDVDARAGLITLNGLKFKPTLRHGARGACSIAADSLSIEGQIWGEVTSARLVFSGFSFPSSCLPPEQGVMVAAVGYPIIRVGTLTADAAYTVGSSALDVSFAGEVEDALRFDAVAAFDYFWLGDDALPEQARSVNGSPSAADLSFAEISLSDAGAVERLGPMLGAMIGGLGNAPALATQGMRNNLTEGGAVPLAPEAAAFLRDLEDGMSGLLNQHRDLVVSVTPATPLRLNSDVANDPALLLAALSPAVSQQVAARDEVVDTALLTRVLQADASGEDAGLSDGERMRVGRALATGVGAPLSPASALSVLAPLNNAWSADAALLSAKAALAQGDVQSAYGHALVAASGGDTEALTLLSTLEAQLPANGIFAAQAAAADDWPGGEEWSDAFIIAAQAGDVAAMRAAARQVRTGRNGPPRNYEYAYLLAGITAAAGDRSAAELRDRIARKFLTRSEADRAEWAKLAARAEASALQTWVDMDLAATFRGSE